MEGEAGKTERGGRKKMAARKPGGKETRCTTFITFCLICFKQIQALTDQRSASASFHISGHLPKN